MGWLKRLAIVTLALFALLMVIGLLVPKRYRDEAAQRHNERRQPSKIRPFLPEWVKSADRSGPTMTIVIDASAHPKGQLVGTLGRQILDLAEDYRRGRFPIPAAVDHVLVVGEVDLFDEMGAPTGSQAVLRSSFTKARFIAAARPTYNFWSVFQLADHTSQTRVARINNLLDGFCDTSFGREAGDLCRP